MELPLSAKYLLMVKSHTLLVFLENFLGVSAISSFISSHSFNFSSCLLNFRVYANRPHSWLHIILNAKIVTCSLQSMQHRSDLEYNRITNDEWLMREEKVLSFFFFYFVLFIRLFIYLL